MVVGAQRHGERYRAATPSIIRGATALRGAALALALSAPAQAAPSDACRAAAAAPGAHAEAALLQRQVGQMIMVGLEGKRPGEGTVARTRDLIGRGELGGVLLLGRNLGSGAEVRALVDTLKPRGAPVEPLVAIDQEGGRVQRMRGRQGVPAIPSAARMGRLGSRDARRTYRRAARELARVGLNVNFGPVIDLALEPRNTVIVGLQRSYGRDPDTVTRLARIFIDEHQAAGVAVAVKHFPGHGSSLADSHEGFTDITRTWDRLELVPYRALAAHTDMVMTGHLYHSDLPGSGGHPVTLAPGIIDSMLRRALGFDGVVVTDDLDMGAIAKHYRLADAVRLAVNAGNDLLLFSSPRRAEGFVPVVVRDMICRGLADGTIEFRRVREANARLTALRERRLNR